MCRCLLLGRSKSRPLHRTVAGAGSRFNARVDTVGSGVAAARADGDGELIEKLLRGSGPLGDVSWDGDQQGRVEGENIRRQLEFWQRNLGCLLARLLGWKAENKCRHSGESGKSLPFLLGAVLALDWILPD